MEFDTTMEVLGALRFYLGQGEWYGSKDSSEKALNFYRACKICDELPEPEGTINDSVKFEIDAKYVKTVTKCLSFFYDKGMMPSKKPFLDILINLKIIDIDGD